MHRRAALKDLLMGLAAAALAFPLYFGPGMFDHPLAKTAALMLFLAAAAGAVCFVLMAVATDSAYRLAASAQRSH